MAFLRRSTISTIGVIFVFTLILSVESTATPVLDQAYESGDALGTLGQPDNAQTFTVGQTGTLDEIQVQVFRNYADAEDLVIDVRGTSSGAPLETDIAVLAGTTISADTVPLGTPTWVSFDVSSFRIGVETGDILAIALRVPTTDLPASYFWMASPRSSIDPYAGGQRWIRNDATWDGTSFDYATTDMNFRTFVEPASAPGGSETDPLLPLNNTPPFVFELEDGTQVVWIDPIVATGFEYAISSGPNFASVTMPSLATVPQTTPYELLLFDGIDFVVEALLNPGDTYLFSAGGESLFRIAGIDASLGLDPDDPLAFPTGLSFLTDELVSFSMTPITITINGVVPEPITLSLMALGLAGIGYRRRRPAMAA